MEFHHRPSTVAFMLRALYPSRGLRPAGGFPPIRATWRQHRIDRRHLARFLAVSGLRADDGLPMLYPHVFGFPLQMVVLTHRAYPLPIWGALQIRNHLLQHRPLHEDAALDLEAGVAGQRVLEKGIEVDLHTTVRSRDGLLWESINTFYYRGRFGRAGAASALARTPDVEDVVVARWHTSPRGGWRFGGLTGDYNGIHWARWYARLLGFRRAFHHPQSVLGQCMARLPAADRGPAQRLDTWLKGPVYYGSDVRLRARSAGDSTTFALLAAGEERPAIVGRWRSAPAGSRLLDEHLDVRADETGGDSPSA